MRSRQMRFAMLSLLLLLSLPGSGRAASFVDTLAIPNGEVISFSPDGQWLLASHPIRSSAGSLHSVRASLQSDDDEPKLCVYAFPSLTPRSCTAPGTYRGANGPRGIVDMVTWSPDGDSIAFSDGSVRTGIDGDIWQLETDSGRFTNLTDDNFSGQVPLGEGHDPAVFLDTLPSYAPDGESIAFVRMTVGVDGRAQPAISRLELASGEVAQFTALPNDPYQLPVGRLIWSADGSTLWFSITGIDESVVGLYSVAIDGSSPVQITAPVSDPRDEMVLLEVSPSAEFAIVGLTRGITRIDPPFYATVDLKTGKMTTLSPELDAENEIAYDVIVTPDDDLIFAIETRGEGNADDVVRLVRQNRSSGTELIVADGLPNLNFFPLSTGMTLITDDLIAYPVNTDDDSATWAVISLSGVDPLPSTPVAAFPPGSTVITTFDVALRTTPSTTGAISQPLTAGTELIVIDAPVEVDGITWIPVREPASGALGYIPSGMITTQSE